MEEGDIVLCTVREIVGTTVFVDLESGEAGTIVTSEIAPGRIRNLREYVVPKKKIVCKILRISGDQIDLSLRRVSSKEKKEVLEKYKQEQTSKSAMKSIMKDDADKTIKKILDKYESLFDFLSSAKEEPKILDEFIPKKYLDQIKKITEKKRKDVEIKEVINLKSHAPDGIKKIKEIMNFANKKIKATYLSAGKFQINITDSDYKSANKKMQDLLEEMEKNSKKLEIELQVKKK